MGTDNAGGIQRTGVGETSLAYSCLPDNIIRPFGICMITIVWEDFTTSAPSFRN